MKLIMYFIITLSCELIASFIYLRKQNFLKTDLSLAVLAANLISFPLAWVCFCYLIDKINVIYAFTITEILVIVLEAFVLQPQLKLGKQTSVGLASFANVFSASIGVILWQLC